MANKNRGGFGGMKTPMVGGQGPFGFGRSMNLPTTNAQPAPDPRRFNGGFDDTGMPGAAVPPAGQPGTNQGPGGMEQIINVRPPAGADLRFAPGGGPAPQSMAYPTQPQQLPRGVPQQDPWTFMYGQPEPAPIAQTARPGEEATMEEYRMAQQGGPQAMALFQARNPGFAPPAQAQAQGLLAQLAAMQGVVDNGPGLQYDAAGNLTNPGAIKRWTPPGY